MRDMIRRLLRAGEPQPSRQDLEREAAHELAGQPPAGDSTPPGDSRREFPSQDPASWPPPQD